MWKGQLSNVWQNIVYWAKIENKAKWANGNKIKQKKFMKNNEIKCNSKCNYECSQPNEQRTNAASRIDLQKIWNILHSFWLCVRCLVSELGLQQTHWNTRSNEYQVHTVSYFIKIITTTITISATSNMVENAFEDCQTVTQTHSVSTLDGSGYTIQMKQFIILNFWFSRSFHNQNFAFLFYYYRCCCCLFGCSFVSLFLKNFSFTVLHRKEFVEHFVMNMGLSGVFDHVALISFSRRMANGNIQWY